jgi:hypothetical protein
VDAVLDAAASIAAFITSARLFFFAYVNYKNRKKSHVGHMHILCSHINGSSSHKTTNLLLFDDGSLSLPLRLLGGLGLWVLVVRCYFYCNTLHTTVVQR